MSGSKNWFILENPIKMDDLGENPLFSETSISEEKFSCDFSPFGTSSLTFQLRIKAAQGAWPNALQLLQDADLVALGGSVASNTAVTWLIIVP